MRPPVVLYGEFRAEHVLAVTDGCAVIVEGPTLGDVLGRERHAEIEVEQAVPCHAAAKPVGSGRTGGAKLFECFAVRNPCNA